MTNIPGQSEIYASFKAHNLGHLDGSEAARSGAPRELRWNQSRHGQFTDMEWDEYRRGWDEALDAYGTANA